MTPRVRGAALLAVALALAACRGPEGSSPAPDVPITGGTDALKLLQVWSWPSPPPLSAGMPAPDDDAVALVCGRHRLVLLDGSGSPRWQADRAGLRDVAPALTPDVIVVAAEEGVAAYERTSSRPGWDAVLGERANSPVIAAGKAIVTTWEGLLVALELTDGRVAWRLGLGGPALGPPAVAAKGSIVVATFDSGRAAGAVAVDAATGQARWTVPLPPDGVSAPAVTSNGVVAVVAGDSTARGLALDDGKERWQRRLEGAGSPEVPPLPQTDGSVVVAHRQGGMALLDGSTAVVRWEASSDGAAVRGGPAGPGPNGWFALPLDDGRLLLAGADREPDLRKPSGLVSGIASGPGGLLLVATAHGPDNRVTAIRGW